MNNLSTRTKLMASLAVALCALFVFAESSHAQHLLLSSDNAMGSGLLPIVCFALPGGVLLLLSFASYRADRRRTN